jgi:hypothetical protein
MSERPQKPFDVTRRSFREVRPAKPQPEVYRAFRLKEILALGSETGAEAYMDRWDPDMNSGEGGYQETDIVFTVKDTRQVGYYGPAGRHGVALMKICKNGLIGEIVDLECP